MQRRHGYCRVSQMAAVPPYPSALLRPLQYYHNPLSQPPRVREFPPRLIDLPPGLDLAPN